MIPVAGVEVDNTKRMVIKKDFLASDSFLLTMDIQWCMAVDMLGGIVPKVDDVFQDGTGVRWVIKKSEDHESSFKLSCLRLQGVA